MAIPLSKIEKIEYNWLPGSCWAKDAAFIFIPASLMGSVLGKKVVERVPQDRFRFFIAGFIILAGLKLFIFP